MASTELESSCKLSLIAFVNIFPHLEINLSKCTCVHSCMLYACVYGLCNYSTYKHLHVCHSFTSIVLLKIWLEPEFVSHTYLRFWLILVYIPV